MSTETITFRTPDHPEANGRQPKDGERAYPMQLPLEDGRSIIIAMGTEGFQKLTDLLFDMLTEAPSHDDGTTQKPSDTALLNWLIAKGWDLSFRFGKWNVLRVEGMMATGIACDPDLRKAIEYALAAESLPPENTKEEGGESWQH